MKDIATQAVIALSIALVVWYLVGSWLNRRRGMSLLRWIREGVRAIGGEATMRWLGRSSGFQVTVGKAKHPFRRMEMMVLLEPREILLLWPLNHLRGRRDTLILKADLRTRPRSEVEILPRRGGIAKKILKAIQGEAWAKGGIEDTDLMVLRKGKEVADLAEKLAPLLRGYAPHILRLSLQKQSPHLLVNLTLPGLESTEAEALFGLWKGVIEASQRI